MAVSARQSHNVFWNGVACGDVLTSLTSCGSGYELLDPTRARQ